ncbi:MAG: class IV adenylate cyclase [Pseudomonadota bacterium]
MRRFADGSAELIYYERDDTAEPEGSFYLVAPQADPDCADAALRRAVGYGGRVRKQRTSYRVGRTRVHLDRVDGLGDFMELEVVLAESDEVGEGVAEAERIRTALGIPLDALVEGAYLDLLSRDAMS